MSIAIVSVSVSVSENKTIAAETSNLASDSTSTHNNSDNKIEHVNNIEEFDAVIDTEKRLVVVDWYAQWCGPCKRIAPELEKLAMMHKDRVMFIKVDVDVADELAARYGVTAMPTFMLFKQGQMLVEFKGADVKRLEQEIAKHC